MRYSNQKLSLFVQPIVLLFAIFVLALSWLGFYGGDDFKYYRAAKDWLEGFPPDLTTEGALRFGVTLPLAASLTLLGDFEFSAVLPTSLYYLSFILFIAYALHRLTDSVTAIVAGALLASVPLLATWSTTVSADIANLLYASLSFFLFYAALDHDRRNLMLFLSGVFAGIGFISHEQNLVLIFFYGLLFVAGYRIERKTYLYIALGIITLLLADMACLFFTSHDVFYRLNVLLGATQYEDRFNDAPPPKIGGIDNTGNLYIWQPINPILLTLITIKYGLLYYLLYPALWWVIRGHIIRDEKTTQLLRLLVVLGVLWFLFAAFALSSLKLYPRYYLAATVCFFIVGVFWLRYVIWPHRRKMTIFAVLLVLAVNFLCITVENKDPRFGERALVEYLNVSTGPMLTDAYTARLAKYFCEWEQQIDCSRIVASKPMPGSVYFLNPNNSDVNPDPHWKEIWSLEQPRKWTGIIITTLGLEPFVPKEIFCRLNQPNKPVTAYLIANQADDVMPEI